MKNGKKLVVIIHTSFVSVNDLKELFAEIVPEVLLHNIVDDSLLAEVMQNGGITPSIIRRVCNYAVHAEMIGADLIFNQCSSVGEAVNAARSLVSIPYIKVDEPMAAEAVRIGERITVVATVASTMKPSVNLVKEASLKAGKNIKIKECLVDGALDILMKEGNREKHNQLVLEAIKKIENESDVIVLAQGSMIVLLPMLADIKLPVLSSPRMGVENVRKALAL